MNSTNISTSEIPLISVVTPCYNEEENVDLLYLKVREQFHALTGKYTYEHIFIDNASTDKTVELLKQIAEKDKNVKIIREVTATSELVCDIVFSFSLRQHA